MKDTIWIVKTLTEPHIYNVFEDETEAEEFYKDAEVKRQIMKYVGVEYCDWDWQARYEEEARKLEALETEVEGMRTALADAKAEAEKRINVAMEELRVARSDVHALEEVIVKMAMRLVGM